jgi:hypothetical protein
VLPTPISLTRWTFLGENVLRSRIRGHLRESIALHIKQELHLYGMALSGWSEEVVRKMETLVNSYADAYRVQLRRVNGLDDESIDLEQIESDLDLLLGWSETRASELEAQQA